MNLKNPLIISLSLFCACRLAGYGEWEPFRTNMFVVNRTDRTIKVWIRDAKVSASTTPEKSAFFQPMTGISGWELAPDQSGWFHYKDTGVLKSSRIVGPSPYPFYPPLSGPLFWQDETGAYMVKHFSPWRAADGRIEVEIRSNNDRGTKYKDLPGFYMRRPWHKGVWPATKVKNKF